MLLPTLKLDSWGFKEFGSGDGPPPPTVPPIFSTITTLHLQDTRCMWAPAHALQGHGLCYFSDALNGFKSHTLLIPTRKADFFTFFNICCSHGQGGDSNCYQAFGSLMPNRSLGVWGGWIRSRIMKYHDIHIHCDMKHFLGINGETVHG